MLAGVESMLRHREILQGAKFDWITDHKGLIHLLKQRNLSGRQARWIEKISEFDFEVVYVPGLENNVADALSRMYHNDEKDTVRAPSEFAQFDVGAQPEGTRVLPMITGLEARAAMTRSQRREPVPPREPTQGAISWAGRSTCLRGSGST